MMSNMGDELQRIEAIFQAAVDMQRADRTPFLDRECGDDAVLRGRVDAMLRELERGASLPRVASARDPDEVPVPEGPGTVIGRYKLLQKIGEGGFGVVYMAEQERPIVRRVALKIIKLGMDTREVVARFEAERQALALMDHPHIARVLDGGATESGRPFFVMELVRGVSITEFCDENSLSTDERLELFISVCHAVQHAHQKGVIHRDLKPSNVMVTLHDGKPVPKVIDFGVAKAMHSRLTEKTLFTAFGRFIGTPAYMSPEQAELSGLDVDTRTDIYSLGVLLYELLTGTTPFDLHRIFEEGLAAIQRTIREESPERPSMRVSTSADATIASRRDTDATALARMLRGDLDWIVMRCLEKERGRRYETASELAADIERHMRDEIVLAGPPSAIYRTRKFLVRNRAAAFSALVVLLGLVVGIVGMAIGTAEARAEKRLAVAEAERTRSVTDFLVETLSLTDPNVARTADLSVITLLDKASARVSEVFEDQPESEARIRITIGRGYRALGENELAEHHLRRGIEIMQAREGSSVTELYRALWDLTNVLFYLESPDALQVAQVARRVAHDHIRATYPEVAESLDHFIDVVNTAAYSVDDEALLEVPRSFRETVRITDARLAPGDRLWPMLADTWIAGAFTLWYGKLDALTVDLFARAVEIQRRELPANHPVVAETTGVLVNAYNRNGRAAEAEGVIRDMVDRMRAVLPPRSPQLGFAESMLGENLVALGKYAEAEPLLIRGHSIVVETIDDPTNFFVTESLSRVLRLYDAWGKEPEADEYRAQMRETCAGSQFLMPWLLNRLAIGAEYEEIQSLMDPLNERLGLIHFRSRPGEVPEEEVRTEIERLMPVVIERFAEVEPLRVLAARIVLAWARAIAENGDLRRTMVEYSLSVLGPREDREPHEIADAHAQLADILLEDGAREEGLAHAMEAWTQLDGRAGDWVLANVKLRVARTLVGYGLFAEAERLLVPAHARLLEHFGPENPEVRAGLELLVRNYTEWGKPEEARAVQDGGA